MIKRHSILFTCILLFRAASFAEPAKEQLFAETVKAVVDAFSKQDSTTLSKFTNKSIGVYVLYRGGVYENFHHYPAVSFPPDFPRVLITEVKGIQMQPIQYTSLPTWDCDKEKWTKSGLFVDTTKTNHLLSKICTDRNKWVPDSIPAKTILQYKQLENKSRRIVLQDGNDKELVFYLSYINGRWYLIIIDKATSDCSA
jgi:hypothetical protein